VYWELFQELEQITYKLRVLQPDSTIQHVQPLEQRPQRQGLPKRRQNQEVQQVTVALEKPIHRAKRLEILPFQDRAQVPPTPDPAEAAPVPPTPDPAEAAPVQEEVPLQNRVEINILIFP
jgi:hypothetical protein